MVISKFLRVLVLSLLTSMIHMDVAAAMGWVGRTLDGRVCEGGGQGFGPYDYFDVDEKSDPLYDEGRHWEIDKIHTGVAVKALSAGNDTNQADFGYAAGHLDYTLRAIPNDPRALQEVIRLNFIQKNSNLKVRNIYPPAECYFLRAKAFRPLQSHIPLLFGVYLHRLGEMDNAVEEYSEAIRLDPKNAEAHYNIGLAYLSLNITGKAAEHASKAYQYGYPLPGLRLKLKRRGIAIPNAKDGAVSENDDQSR